MDDLTPEEILGRSHGLSPWRPELTNTQVVRRSKAGRRPGGTAEVMRAFQNGELMIYAMSVPGDIIKIGCSANLAFRRQQLNGDLLGFKFGDFGEERETHRLLAASVARGREWYYRTPEVIDFINELRQPFGLDELAA